MRKIIQLVCDPDGDFFCLCDDGTVWVWSKRDWNWIKALAPAPQYNPEE